MDGDMLKGFVPTLITIGVICGVILGFVLFKVVPWAWNLAKPFIHSITA
jgi:hypothetical protein